LLFSDYEEHYRDEHVLNALDSVSPEIRANHPEFEPNRRLQQNGRAAPDPREFGGSEMKVASPGGNLGNPRRKLDK